MISTQPIVYCTNSECSSPINSVGNTFCAECQTPLVKNFLWATGSIAAQIETGEMVNNRYEVISPQVWLDSQPMKLPDIPQNLVPAIITPYLKLYRHQLHLPQVYGWVDPPKIDEEKILLLENVPVDEVGNIYPSITKVWSRATAVRQVYWLWQIIRLWQPLEELGVSASLLVPSNLRVQGWCVRLLELIEDLPNQAGETGEKPKWQDLADCWQPWLSGAKYPIAKPLQRIVKQMSSSNSTAGSTTELEAIETQLNELLLSSAGELPLTMKVAGKTDKGTELTRNEDTCFPCNEQKNDKVGNALEPQVAIVCDGIGGHEGGEVASQLALQSMLLQVRAFLAEIAIQEELNSPILLQEQLEASLRVVNNLICANNNRQNRSARERMATTLVMGLQVPQSVNTVSEWRSGNAHELYIANVGDSRAYWITKEHCRLLTTDDDVTAREVENSRSLYRQALSRPDAEALTQALGTKEGEFLHPIVQRIIIEEDGLLLLCSDGLSDISSGGGQKHRNWVEYSWRTYAVPVLSGEITLEKAVQSWIELANQKNGRDNTSIVLTYYRISPEYPTQNTETVSVEIVETELTENKSTPESQTSSDEEFSDRENFTDSSQALLDLENMVVSPSSDTSEVTAPKTKKPLKWLLPFGLLIVLLGGTACGLFIWWRINPSSFNRTCKQLPTKLQQICPIN
ncbi:MAG: protein phosphatase 2C domain-containing protein [Cyanobacteria bacterium P01_A01_bin.84]